MAVRFAVLLVTTGMTAATWTGEPLPTLLVVTTAVNAPAEVGFVESATVSVVALAAVTAPMAPSLKVTVLFPADASKPKPLIVTVAALAAKLVVALVTTGMTEATWTALALAWLLEVTIAVRLPAAVGPVESVTVNEVAVALDTVPAAPLLSTTVLLAAVGSNPNPVIVIVVALAARLVLRLVTEGITVAICVELLATPFVVTTAARLPAEMGLVEKLTVSEVALAVVTVPTAPLLKTTLLLPTTVLNPKP